MKTLFTILLITCSLSYANAQIDSSKVLQEGTIVTLQLLQEISSKTANEGDILEFETVEPVIVGDRVLVSKGAKANGRVTDAAKAKGLGKAGTLEFTIDHLTLSNGKIIKLTSEYSAKGKQKLGAAITQAVLLTPLFLLKKGKNLKFEAGHIFKVFVAKDYYL